PARQGRLGRSGGRGRRGGRSGLRIFPLLGRQSLRLDRRRIVLLPFQRAQASDGAQMLFVGFREGVAAVAVGDEIELLGARRIGGRLQRRTSRIGDRTRRQPLDDVGVVGRRLLDL